MNITILCSDKNHPIWPLLEAWGEGKSNEHTVTIVSKVPEVPGGDLLILISCTAMIRPPVLAQYQKAVVCHASNVPEGRGHAPVIWQILEGKKQICVTMMDVEDKVDSGKIWLQEWFDVAPTDLYSNVNDKLFAAELKLMDYAVENFETVVPHEQRDVEPTYYGRRTPAHSEVQASSTIAEAFDLLRVCDPDRYPVYFNHLGETFTLKMEKKAKPAE